MNPAHRITTLPVIASLLLILLCTAASPLFTGEAEFSGDDYYYIANNPRVTTHTAGALLEIWRNPMRIEYFPLTITTYALEHRLWGNGVKLYRLTNLLLFIGIGITAWSLSLRVYRILRPDGEGATPVTLTAAALTGLFLLHPLNVESFACISNRKELLYALFALLALCSHLTPTPRWGSTLRTVLFLLLAQLSKGSAVILPLILLIATFIIPAPSRMIPRRLTGVGVGSILCGALFLYQYRIAARAGVVAQDLAIPLLSRIGGVVRTLHTMLSKLILPVDLTYEYDIPWPQGLPPVQEWLLPAALVTLLTLLMVRTNARFLLLALLPLVALLPYSNLIPLKHDIAGKMVFYDHYLLLSTMLLPSLALPLLSPHENVSRPFAAALAALLVILTVADYRLATHWRTQETLYSRMLQISPGLPKPYLFLAKMYEQKKQYQDAIRMLLPIIQKGVRDPLEVDAYLVMANAQAFSGNYPMAEKFYRTYLEYSPTNLQALQNLTATLLEMGRCRDAGEVIDQWQRAYPQDPNLAATRALAAECSRSSRR